MKNFKDMSLQPELMQALEKMNFTTPTPVQTKTIPLILDGHDVLVSAQTGTGKTGAFCIPILELMMQDDNSFALILTPTRELAQQIFDVATDLTKRMRKIRPSLMVGGKPIYKQISHLKSNPRFLVATPGRVIDLLERGALNLKAVQYLVLDETDRMLDMGFTIQVNQILRGIPKERQTMLFSATISKVIEGMSQKYLNNPTRIEMGGSEQPAQNIIQETVTVGNVIKFDTLVDELEKRGGTSIVFTRTKRGADKVANNLCSEGLSAAAIHGDLNQRQRDRVLKQFRDQRVNIMVATDVAARGIDVSHVSLVVNYDLPQSPQDYIHRIGRTARAGAKGTALSFISPGQEDHWDAIEHYLETGQELPMPKKGRSRGASRRGPSSRGNAGGRSQQAGNRRPAGRSSREDGPRQSRSFETGPRRPRSDEDGPRRSRANENAPRPSRPGADGPRRSRANEGAPRSAEGNSYRARPSENSGPRRSQSSQGDARPNRFAEAGPRRPRSSQEDTRDVRPYKKAGFSPKPRGGKPATSGADARGGAKPGQNRKTASSHKPKYATSADRGGKKTSSSSNGRKQVSVKSGGRKTSSTGAKKASPSSRGPKSNSTGRTQSPFA